MKNSITPFAFGESLVRVHKDDKGEPWFVAKDVALALGYAESSLETMGKLLQHVPDEWKDRKRIPVSDWRGVESVSTPSGTQEMLTLSEQGLYFFLGRSDKPGALPFQKWLAGEVLPTLRRTGSYTVPKGALPCRIALPADLPAEALSLRPSMRQRLWRDALDTARMDNAGLDVALLWFGKLCRLVAATPPEPEDDAHKVQAFFAQCCIAAEGQVVRARVLYDAMRRWHRGQSGNMPSMRIFGEEMGRLASRLRSNGSLYRNIALKN